MISNNYTDLRVSEEARLPSQGSEYKLLNTFEFIKAVSDTVLDILNGIYHDKPLILIGATCQERLVSHHQSFNINFWIQSRFHKPSQ